MNHELHELDEISRRRLTGRIDQAIHLIHRRQSRKRRALIASAAAAIFALIIVVSIPEEETIKPEEPITLDTLSPVHFEEQEMATGILPASGSTPAAE